MFKNFNDIPKAFESKTRIQILSSLYVSDLAYSSLKDLCNCSDGKLAGHIKILIHEQYITQTKEFINNIPRTTYQSLLKLISGFMLIFFYKIHCVNTNTFNNNKYE